jgi:hypothetical protein
MEQRGPAKPVTVPVTIRLRDSKPVEMRIVDYLLREDGDMQTILSQRTSQESPSLWRFFFRTTWFRQFQSKREPSQSSSAINPAERA